VRKLLARYRIYDFRWDEEELSDMNDKMQEALHWLPRMHLFFQPGPGDDDQLDPKIMEEIQERQQLVGTMLPSGAQLFYQRILRSVGF
jgi:hypothetical protein